MVPGAGRGQGGTGSSPTIAKFCSTDSGGALPRSLNAADRKDQRNLAASTLLAAPTRAREAAPIPARSASRPTCTGRLRGAAAAGRRRHFFLAELLLADFEVGRSGRSMMMRPPRWRWCRAPVEGREVPGHRQRSRNSAAPTVGALSLARSTLRIGKISGIWQRQPFWLPPRARARRRRFQRARPADRPAPAGCAALRLLADVDISF